MTPGIRPSDAQLAGYANFYYEYDSQRRATREIVDAGSRTFTFTYTQSAFPDDYNNWKVRTVETLPDATQNIVYTNYIGQILIQEHKSGADRWIEYFQFSSDGRKTLAATPAAVIDYDDSSADLNVNLRTAAGKIHLTEYYTSSGGGPLRDTSKRTNLRGQDSLTGQIMTTKSPDPFDPIKYGYNRASSPTYARDEMARANGADLDQLYSYDGLPRLIDFQQGQLNAGNTAISSSTLTQEWDLDQVGNWDGFHQGVSGVLDQTRTHNRVNEITDISNGSGQPVWIDPAYDDAGNMTLTPRLDAPTAGFTLTYDAWNRITKVETTDVSPKLVAQYAYDGRKHRISKEVYDAAGSLESTIKFFYNAAWQCLEERETPVGSSSSTSTYVWGQRYIDDIVCRDAVSGRLYAMQDRQYKTLAIINTGGTVQERYSYTPYGKTFVYDSIFTVRTASAFDWVYLYTGRRFDRETGLYYFRNRYYDSSLGRFCSRDPITYFDGMNRYGNYFVLNAMDPSGLSWYGSLGRGIVQGVIGGVIVVGVATLAVTLGAPIAVVTIGIGVVGVVGAAIVVADTIQDPSVDNIAENAGILIGGAIVGGIAGRPLACRLSPLGNQPPPGRLPSLVHEIAQGMEIRPGSSVLEQLIFVNGQGPTTGGAEGAITGGAGIIDLAK